MFIAFEAFFGEAPDPCADLDHFSHEWAQTIQHPVWWREPVLVGELECFTYPAQVGVGQVAFVVP